MNAMRRWVVALLLVSASQLACAQVQPYKGANTAYVSGELLVKVTEEAAKHIEQARQQGTLPVVGIESLDRLFAKYDVSAIEPIFMAQDIEAIKERFPERAKRAEPGAEVPELSGLYRLRLNPKADVQEAVGEFTRNPHVEYAQPNHLMTIYRR